MQLAKSRRCSCIAVRRSNKYEIHPEDPMPGVIAGFAYMRGVLAGMGFASLG